MKRGYILIEVTVGGALVAVIVATLLSTLADSRMRNVVAGRDLVASQLLNDKLDLQRSKGFTNADTGCATEAKVAGQTSTYIRRCVPTTTTQNFLGVGGVTRTINCKVITVQVEYRPQSGARIVEGRTWVCE